MTDRQTFKIDTVEAGGISSDGRNVHLDVQCDGDAIRLAIDFTQARPAGLALLAAADAAQRTVGIAHLSNLIRAEAVGLGRIEGDTERLALALRLEGGSSLTLSLPLTALRAIAATLGGSAAASDPDPGALPVPPKH